MNLPQTPLQTARLAAFGSLLLFIAGICSFIPFPGVPEHYKLYELLYHGRWEVLLILVPFIVGLAIAYFFQRRLSQGVRRQIWCDEQIDQARAWVESPAFTSAMILNILCMAATPIISTSGHHHGGDWFFFMFAGNPFTMLRQTLRRPAKPGHRIDWTSISPIHSDDWGKPPHRSTQTPDSPY